jgi:hypothetical protein
LIRCTPLYVFSGRHLLAAKLRPSNIDASAGAMKEIARIVAQIRARWPRVRILLRADSGFAREALMSWCETNRVDFLFGLARNARLVEEIYVELANAEEEALRTGRPARRFKDFSYQTLDSWSRRRRVVAKARLWLASFAYVLICVVRRIGPHPVRASPASPDAYGRTDFTQPELRKAAAMTFKSKRPPLRSWLAPLIAISFVDTGISAIACSIAPSEPNGSLVP